MQFDEAKVKRVVETIEHLQKWLEMVSDKSKRSPEWLQQYTDLEVAHSILTAFLEKKIVEAMSVLEIKDIMNSTCQECKSTVDGCFLTCSILANILVGKIAKKEEAKPLPTVGEIKEPHQRLPSNHLEVNYIAVGYYKHEIDFGVLCAISELSKSDFDKMLHMLNMAIKVANDMWLREQKPPSTT